MSARRTLWEMAKTLRRLLSIAWKKLRRELAARREQEEDHEAHEAMRGAFFRNQEGAGLQTAIALVQVQNSQVQSFFGSANHSTSTPVHVATDHSAPYETTEMVEAAKYGDIQTLERLLSFSTEHIEAKNAFGNSPLSEAAIFGQTSCLHRLLSARVPTSRRGTTSILHLCWRRRITAMWNVSLGLKVGANRQAQNASGQTAMDLARAGELQLSDCSKTHLPLQQASNVPSAATSCEILSSALMGIATNDVISRGGSRLTIQAH